MISDKDIYSIKGDELPYRLKEIPDMPEKMNIIGQIPNTEKFLCVVGSRKFTNYGKEVCEKLIEGLRGYDITIVSGLALGIDSIAHRKALEVGLKTIAVPGSGLSKNVLYPRSNLGLAEKIIQSGGALLSEFNNDFGATVWSFPQRNRIMAAMSDAVLVIEAEIKSGTLITSKLATEYNRDVLTVPGSVFSKTSEGPNMLIRLGATPIRNSQDILEALGFKIDETPVNLELKYADCSEEEMKLIELLSEPLEKDELIRKMKKSVSEANTIISIMELKGLLKESMGEIRLV